MQTAIAKIFISGNSQAIRLPKEFRFNVNEVYIIKSGDSLILTPHMQTWHGFIDALSGGFSDDFSVQSNLPDNTPREAFK